MILLLFLFTFYLFFVIGFLHNRTTVYKQDVATGIERQIRLIQRDFGESIINSTNAQSTVFFNIMEQLITKQGILIQEILTDSQSRVHPIDWQKEELEQDIERFSYSVRSDALDIPHDLSLVLADPEREVKKIIYHKGFA